MLSKGLGLCRVIFFINQLELEVFLFFVFVFSVSLKKNSLEYLYVEFP